MELMRSDKKGRDCRGQTEGNQGANHLTNQLGNQIDKNKKEERKDEGTIYQFFKKVKN
jgi:hypothetical protein